jgi:hypothetical protein
MSDSDKKFAQSKGKSLGLNDDQIFDALDGQSDLSPKAVIARAGERKEKEKDKAQAAKITSGLLAEVKRIPSPMDINSPFPVTTKFDFNGDPGPAMSDEPPAKDPNPMDDFISLTTPETEPEKTGGKETTSPTGIKDEGRGFFGSIVSDITRSMDSSNTAYKEELRKKAENYTSEKKNKTLSTHDKVISESMARIEKDKSSLASPTGQVNAFFTRNSLESRKKKLAEIFERVINDHDNGKIDASPLFKKYPELGNIYEQRRQKKGQQASREIVNRYNESSKPGAPS